MANAFQSIVDLAESIGIDKRGVVSQTISRNQTVRAISRGGQIWRFDIKLPDGIPWTTMRPIIESIEQAGLYTPLPIQFNTAGTLPWFMKYQGDSVNYTGFVGTFTTNSTTLTLTTSPTTTSGFKFRVGDLIENDSAKSHVYSVVADVPYNSNTVILNRPYLTTGGSRPLLVGPDTSFRVICTSMPTYNIFARNQVGWSGSFTFSEDMT